MTSTPLPANGPARRKTCRPSRAVHPASSAKEALNRWGFGASFSDGQLVAWHSDRVVIAPVEPNAAVNATLQVIDRHSPNECAGGPVSWSQIYTVPPAAPSKNDPYPRRRRRRTTSRQICWDCQQWLELENRRAFLREFGDYSLEDAEIAVRVTRLDAREVREEIEMLADEASEELYWRDRIALADLLGVDLQMKADRRYEQAKLLVTVRATPLDGRAALLDLVRAAAA